MAIRRGFNRIANFIGIYNDKKYRTLIAIGDFCKDKMDFYVPVDTGYLKSKNDYVVTRAFQQKLRLINDCYYAGFVEFGTSRMVAQPFIRPAFENHIMEIREIVRLNMSMTG